jgi:hypothetical protein
MKPGDTPPRPAAAGSTPGNLPILLSLLAVAIAVAALLMSILRGGAPAAASCRTSAWNAVPTLDTLPSGWSLSGTGFYVDSLATTLVGPTPSDGTQGPTIYVSVSCYGSDAKEALTRSRSAALAAGGVDLAFPPVGNQSMATRDAAAGSLSVYVLRGSLVANLAAPSDIDLANLEQAARAIDTAMTRAETPGASFPVQVRPSAAAVGSDSPAAPSLEALSHVAPDLEKLLPQKVDSTVLVTESTTAATALGDDASSTALIDALKKLGKVPDDLQIAEAYDGSGNVDLYVIAFRVAGVTAPKLAPVIVSGWLAPPSADATTSKVTLAGKAMTKITFGDGGANDYVYQHGDVVFDIETPDEALAGKVAALLP